MPSDNQLIVYQKLQKARVKLQNVELKKSGHNSFAGFKYFELGDFLPTVNSIFFELGLCSVFTIDNNEGIVIKHHTGNRNKVAKVINPDYLIYGEKHDVGDSH